MRLCARCSGSWGWPALKVARNTQNACRRRYHHPTLICPTARPPWPDALVELLQGLEASSTASHPIQQSESVWFLVALGAFAADRLEASSRRTGITTEEQRRRTTRPPSNASAEEGHLFDCGNACCMQSGEWWKQCIMSMITTTASAEAAVHWFIVSIPSSCHRYSVITTTEWIPLLSAAAGAPLGTIAWSYSIRTAKWGWGSVGLVLFFPFYYVFQAQPLSLLFV